MKITIEKYNPNWSHLFNDCKNELYFHLKEFNPIIEHIGSTSINEIAAKPIIDILVGVESSIELDKIADILSKENYIYFEKYNPLMPYRRFFVKLKEACILNLPTIIQDKDEVPEDLHQHKLAHVHILEYNTHHWIRHIAFRDYLRAHKSIANDYQQLKEILSSREWKDGIEYNDAKNEFIQKVEAQAIEWFTKK